jgi:hypothetical protein
MFLNSGRSWRSSATNLSLSDSITEGRSFRSALSFFLFASLLLALNPSLLQAGTACVVAKELGNSLAIEWIASPNETAETALVEAKKRLELEGFKRQKMLDVHAQTTSDLEHGYVLILRAEYTNWRGKSRISYGCGFSPISSKEAGQAALDNLRNYAWGWKAEDGYQVVEERQF